MAEVIFEYDGETYMIRDGYQYIRHTRIGGRKEWVPQFGNHVHRKWLRWREEQGEQDALDMRDKDDIESNAPGRL